MANKKIHWPSKEAWFRIEKKLASSKPSKLPSPNADQVELIKFNLCEALVKYCLDHKLSQRELAKILGVNESRISEIVHYNIEKLTIDRLVKHLSKLEQKIKIQVA